jgi:endonuclease III
MNHKSPSKKELLEAYHRLDSNHQHDLLPLETRLPEELQYQRRDGYRIIMTMILSQRIDDYRLSVSLGRLFGDYPTLKSLCDLTTWKSVKDLLRRYGFQVDGPAAYNVDRIWTLLRYSCGKWSRKIGPDYVDTLEVERGYGPKFIRALRAYHLGERNVLPLDGKGFYALTKIGLYTHDTNINQVRADMERKLNSEKSIYLIDFHELLRFRGQTDGKEVGGRQLEEIIVGWNAWRVLCSLERAKMTEDWIYKDLIKDKSIAQKLWQFLSRYPRAMMT